MQNLYIKNVSSLEKILTGTSLTSSEMNSASCLLGECFSYQIAIIGSGDIHGSVCARVSVHADSALSDSIEIYTVRSVPVTMPAFPDEYDNDYITRESAVLPDILEPCGGTVTISAHTYKSLWVTVKTCADTPCGTHRIKITFDNEDNTVYGESVFDLKIINAQLPKQSLIFTQWLHCDCISTYYGQEPLSEEHWQYIDKFVKIAADNGVNMLLTPLFTLPLDTAVGHERPTVQLVDVTYNDGVYSFGFDKLKRWLDMCRKNNIEYIEMSHLFTQWGAYHAPKIIVSENGRAVHKFGWHTDSLSDEYKDFLSQLLPELTRFMTDNWDADKVYFHISDEPNADHIEHYGKLHDFIAPYIKGFHQMDAISDYDLYKLGYIETPVPTIRTIDSFIENNAENLWAYYCCGEGKYGLSNRFIAMPSYRNRIIGVQLYKYNIKGFLQWGYNFYYSQFSLCPVDPYVTNDADGAFPAGDSFSVYPGADGPIPSLRLLVFREALQDMRAMQYLETLIGRDEVIRLIDGGGNITFRNYPRCAEYILNLREKINSLIEKAVG